MASSSDDEINTMKVGDTFQNHLEGKKKGKKDQENAAAKANVKTVKEKEIPDHFSVSPTALFSLYRVFHHQNPLALSK